MSAMNAPSRHPTLPLLVLIVVAFGLRIYQLEMQSLWYDEGVTATLAQHDLAALTAWTSRDIQPPLYYYIVAGWGRLTGWSEWSLRFVSAWWGTLLVPLMALLSYRLLHNRNAALAAALLTTTHPLLVYYSQEARMYTMVVALGVLTGYYFLVAMDKGGTSYRRWVPYIIGATATLYTHYFAVFLLLAFGVVGLFQPMDEERRPFKTRLFTMVSVHLTIVLLFALWLIPLLTQLATDRSYWQGTFKITDAIRAIALRFVVGETVLEQFAPPYLWIGGAVTLLSVVLFVIRARQQRDVRQALLLAAMWLLIPTLCVLTLAVAVPKFNVRYVLLALPGLILLWSYGSVTLAEAPKKPLFRGAIGILALLPLVTIFLIADRNWYTDHSFLKAQWREAAAYVRLHHETDEAVVLVSGHTWPVWDYYAPDLPAIHLPDLQILDVDAVLDFEESGTALRDALQGYNGAWLVNWQEEVVDPTGVVPIQLGWAGREKTFRSEFWEVGLRRFIELDPTAIPTAPPLAETLNANFGNQLILKGYNTTQEDELLLFWQLAPDVTAPTTDWQINLQTETNEGLSYHIPPDRRPTDYHYPVERWQPGETVMAMIPALDWAGPAAMPAHYQIQLRIYDPTGDPGGLNRIDQQGIAAGKTATLHVSLRDKTTDRPLPEPTDAVEVSPGLRLSMVPSRYEAEAGEMIPTTLLWYPADDFTPVDLVVRWRRVSDNSIAAEFPLPMPPDLPMEDWPTRDWFRHLIAIPAPADLSADLYQLAIEPAATTSPNTALVVDQEILILESSRTFIAPDMAEVLNIDLYEQSNNSTPQIRLLGLRESPPTTVEPASQLIVAPIWQVPTEIDAPAHDYTISIQLLDEDGLPAAQSDIRLTNGSSSWVSGQVVAESVALTTAPAPGLYRMIIVVYDASREGFPRLETAAGDDFIELAPTIWQP